MQAANYQSSTDRVLAWVENQALHIRFNHPVRHNALSVDMWQALPPLMHQAAQDDAVRMVVFSGAGEKAFASGADITQFDDMRAAKEAVRQYEALAERALEAIADFPKPTLACVRGYCIGGGLNVALSCDLRIASMDAVFSVPAARLGLGYRYSALKNLVELIGPGAAKDMLFTARRVDAGEAYALGLVSRIAAQEELEKILAQYVESIVENAPLTMAAGKAVIREILKPSPELDNARCQQLILNCFDSADYAEGRLAFKEKRKPVFRGK